MASTKGGTYKERVGGFRMIPESFAHDPEFQALSPIAKAVWLILRLQLGQYGLKPFYAVLLPTLVNAQPEEVDGALGELTAPRKSRGHAWLECEGNLFWLVDALEGDVGFTNGKHREGARRYLETLPSLPLLTRFRERYNIPLPSPAPPEIGIHPMRDRDAIPHPIGVTNGDGYNAVENAIGVRSRKTTRIREKETDKERDNENEKHTESSGDSENLSPSTTRFLTFFYGKASEAKRRQRVRHLHELLAMAETSAPRFGLNAAKCLAALDRCCDRAVEEPPKPGESPSDHLELLFWAEISRVAGL